MTARFAVTVRGQGATEGHYLREVAIEGEQRLLLFQSDEGRDRMAAIGREMIEQAATLRNKVLKIPLLTLVQAGDPASISVTRWQAPGCSPGWIGSIRRSSPSSSIISSPAPS
jgi:hypothetical protein